MPQMMMITAHIMMNRGDNTSNIYCTQDTTTLNLSNYVGHLVVPGDSLTPTQILTERHKITRIIKNSASERSIK